MRERVAKILSYSELQKFWAHLEHQQIKNGSSGICVLSRVRLAPWSGIGHSFSLIFFLLLSVIPA